MSTYLPVGTSEWRYTTSADLSGATLTMLAERGPVALTIPVAIAGDDPKAVILQLAALPAGNYRIQLRAVRTGKTAYFPSSGPEELNIFEPPS